MGEALVSQEALTEKIAFMRTILDERQYRLYLASEANALGRGGMSLVSKASGASMVTIRKGLEEMRDCATQINAENRRTGLSREINDLTVRIKSIALSLSE